MTSIVAPTTCPSCASPLEERNRILYCINEDCGEQSYKRVEHFAKSLKIKGLGPATIRKLDITNIGQLYTYTEDELAEALGSEKIAEKLWHEIQNSMDAPLNLLLPAFSIPLVGKHATEKLAKVCEDLFEITDEICRLAKLGEKTTASLLKGIEKIDIDNLPFNFEFLDREETKYSQGVVCITGKLTSYKTKQEAMWALNAAGYNVKSNLTSDVTILINESGIESAKTKNARNNGIQIVTDITELLGE
tara:strand:+ start:4662 stop:5405 length:744 start_codon:yes stop_codon:yes gene_type:complete